MQDEEIKMKGYQNIPINSKQHKQMIRLRVSFVQSGYQQNTSGGSRHTRHPDTDLGQGLRRRVRVPHPGETKAGHTGPKLTGGEPSETHVGEG